MLGLPAILNAHTPSSSFAIIHSREYVTLPWMSSSQLTELSVGSATQESLATLFDKLSRKVHAEYHGERVGPGWLKYDYDSTIWNLDDGEYVRTFISPFPRICAILRKYVVGSI